MSTRPEEEETAYRILVALGTLVRGRARCGCGSACHWLTLLLPPSPPTLIVQSPPSGEPVGGDAGRRHVAAQLPGHCVGVDVARRPRRRGGGRVRPLLCLGKGSTRAATMGGSRGDDRQLQWQTQTRSACSQGGGWRA